MQLAGSWSQDEVSAMQQCIKLLFLGEPRLRDQIVGSEAPGQMLHLDPRAVSQMLHLELQAPHFCSNCCPVLESHFIGWGCLHANLDLMINLQ